jgi:transposase
VIEELGHEVVVADPNFAPMYSQRSRRVKTDRRDALALAEACRLGAYRRAHRTSDPRRHIRGFLSVRDSLVRARTRWIVVVRAVLRREGFHVRNGHSEGFAGRVAELSLPDHLRLEIAPLLRCLEPLNKELARLDKRLGRMLREDDAARRLATVPGVGPVTALAFVATVDRVERFTSGHQVASYLGLVPREWSSSETQRRGRITKAGNKRTRWLLGEAARCVLRCKKRESTQRLRDWAERIGARRGGGVAVVALARRLAGILSAMWRDGTVYDPQHLESRLVANRAA